MDRIFTFPRIRTLFFFCFLVIFSMLSYTVRAQGPGGVSTGLNLWLDASNGTAVTGSNLTGWTDKASINTFAVSATPPTVTANAINFNSTVNFNNSIALDVYPGNQNLIGNTAINYTDGYAVFKVNDPNGGVIIGGTSPGSSYGKAIFAEFNSGIHSGNGEPTTYSSFPFTDFDNFHVFGMDAALAGNMIGRLDGADQSMTDLLGFSSINFVPTVGTTNNNGNSAGWNHLNGQIAEVIVYDQTTSGQRINIESYLAIKYGIHKTGNYVDSANTILWNAVINSVYHNDVFGVGQDTASGLLQTQSNSMNTGSGDGTGQGGKGNIVISNPSSLSNNSFLLIGHDSNNFSFVTTNLPTGSPIGFARMDRIWKTETTGSVGTINLEFDVTAISIPGTLSGLQLLVDDDGDGNFATGTVTIISSSSVSGNKLLFDNVNFPPGATFTFGTINTLSSTIGPGGIASSDLVLWLKANAGTSTVVNGAGVTTWNDQSTNNNHATVPSSMAFLSGGSAIPLAPTFQTNYLNFNPSLNFNGTSGTSMYAMQATFSVPITSNNISAYVVQKMNTQTATTNGRVITISNGYNISDYDNTNGIALIERNGGNDVIHSTRNGVSLPGISTILGKDIILSTHFTTSNQYRIESNGSAFTTNAYTTANLNSQIYRLGNSTIIRTDYFNGNIAEVIFYKTDQSSISNNHNKIETYLAIKYGFTLGTSATPANYISSNDAVIWDGTANLAYHNDVFGIGKDDASDLNQTTSNSTNTGSGNGTGQSAKGNIIISNPSSLVNNSFLIVGHNTNALTEADVIDGANTTKRVQRLWKVQTTGTTGTVSLSYDITGLTYSGHIASDFSVLVDPTGTGTFDGSSLQYIATSISGNKVNFDNINLPNGAVFTFQTLLVPVIPTVQATNVSFTNTTGTTTTASWTNGTGSSRAVFIYAGASGSPVPVDNTTYTANNTFGAGTQIGTTGWYCVYNGTGTTVNITGLTQVTTYQLMVVEYNGSTGNEIYLTTTSTGNPVGITTITSGPGGVLGEVIWYKANSGITLNATNVAQWNDFSGNNNNAIQPTGASQPLYTTNSINFNQAVTFSGTNYLTAPVNNLPSGNSARSIFVVASSTNTQPTNSWVYGYGTATLGRAFNIGKLLNATTLYASAYGNEAQSSSNFWTVNVPKLGTVTYNTPTVSFFDAGASIGTSTQAGWNTLLTTNSGRIGAFVNATNELWRGNIAEIILYPSLISVTAAISVESYLAIKYGIHKTGNYLNSAGTVVWDATANAAYHNDVFGISKDDTSDLNQTISNSTNTGSGNGTGQSGKGNIIISNPSSLVNNSFLIVGHNTGPLTEITGNVPGFTIKRVQRLWKSQTTGTPGNVTLSYDVTGLTYSAQSFSDYALLVDPTGTGDFTGGSVVKYPAVSLTANKVTFNNVALPTGAVFTFQTFAAPLPPVVTSFSPQSGPAGTTVVINGANFGATAAENIVFFGAAQAVVSAASTTSLTVTVPAGASFQQISVLNGTTVLLGYSTIPFNTSFTPNKGNITIDDIQSKIDFTTVSQGNSGDISMGDFDADGKIDLAIANNVGAVTIFKNSSTSGAITSSSFTSAGNFTVGTNPQGIVVGDLDADGKLDIAVSNRLSNTISILRNTSTGSGNINFASATSYAAGDAPIGIVMYDFDKDGKSDIIVSNFSSSNSNVSIFKNTSSGIGNINFAPRTFFATDNGPVRVELGDFDNDNKMDIAVASYLADKISIFQNTTGSGSITFSGPIGFASGGARPNDIVVGDLDGDGKADIIMGNENISSISILHNTSSGAGNFNFSPTANLTVTGTVNRVAVNDLDGDGKLDIAAGNSGSSLFVFRNTSLSGAISFGNRVDYSNLSGTAAIIMGDFDGDGKNDIANLSSNNISVFRNNPLFEPTVQATNVVFSATTGTATTATWTNGNGSSRAVFMFAGSTGSPLPVNFTAYTANPAFGSGTQIGTSGWYCIYNGTGTTVNITGLTPGTNYQVMVVEQNGSPTDEMYLTTASTGNPAALTTLSNDATLSNLTLSEGTLDPVFASATTIYTATVPYTTTTLTVTPTTTEANATVTVNGTAVTSGSASGTINLSVGANVITTVVTAQDGTTLGTYTITVTRLQPTIVTTGSLSALTTVYGTPSASGTFNVSGTNMIEGVVISPPAGFEVSSDNINFAVSIAIGGSTTITDIPVYIRLKETDVVGDYSGDVVLTSDGAADVNVPTVLSTVTPAPLTITADNQTKVYGEANPTLTVTYTGFVNGDTEASLTTPPTVSTTAVTGSAADLYTIIASGAVSPNYDITYVNGNLNITPAPLTITADNQTKVYGDTNPTLTASYTGFVNGDTEASLTTPATISTTADATSAVGTYPITASGAVNPNYSISYVDGTLTVTPAVLTITAESKTKVFGSANPPLTLSYAGFVNGDDETDLSPAPTISTTAVLGSPVGNYPITPSGGANPNYTISYVGGTLTVTPAVLTITADNQTKIYGDANPTLTVSYTGFVNGDTEASLTTPPTITTTADVTSVVGTYPITASGAVSSNYTFTYVDGTLTVTPAVLTITADNQTKVYGDANSTLTASYAGFVNGDTAASLTTPPTITTTADATSIVGTYPITASGAASSNYSFTYVDGTLTVTPAVLTITADNQTKVYGDANPTLTASYAGFVNGDTSASLTTPPTITTTADVTSVVGTYPITASGAASANYTFTYVDGALQINPANLQITADDQIKTYGSANPPLTINYTGFVNGDTEANLTTPAIASTTATTSSPVGIYPIIVSGATSPNYTIGYAVVDATLTVNPALVTITADNQTKIYGDANPTLTASYAGFVNGDTSASLTTPPTIITTADATSIVGAYPITASGAASSNYTFTYVDGTLTVTPAVLTITADNQTKVYGDTNPTLTASYAGFVNGDTSASLTTAPTITTTADATSVVGTYPITASGAVSSNYTFTYVDGTLTVTPAVLTITADNQTKIYGDVNPTLTASYTGFVNGDTSASLTTAPTITTTADATSAVGTYPITASGAASANYTFTYVDGTLTVTPAVLTITADNQTKIYGDANPTLTASYAGFVNGDTSASLTTAPTITTTVDTTSVVGTYPITASGAASANYTFTYVDGTLTVTPAVLTITADNQTKIYGDANPTLTASYTGFVNGDTSANLTTAPTISTTADAISVVGTYPITANGATSANYTFTYVDGTLTVTPAVLTITADNQTKIYGDANPTLTASYAGFVNGDTSASLTTAPTITTTADTTSAVGTYPITASGAASANYTFTYVDGTLTITPAILTITADNQTKIYGDANPALTASYSGFVNGDTSASLTTLPTITTTADATSAVGTYPITASGAASANYTFTYVDGTLTVTPAILTITPDNQTKIYGDANPILTASYAGFVNGDTSVSLTTLPTISTTADATSIVGTYPITASGAASSNYTFTYVDGTLTVTPAVLTITADNQTKIYGDANPTLTASYAGFVNGDTSASLTTAPTISTTADATSIVGTYPITASGAVSANYTFTYVDGTLTVTPAILTITADNQTKIYGDANPTLTASYAGFVNGDTSASLTTAPTITTTADATSIVGTYPITASGAVSANYTFAYIDGTLTVTPAVLTITADNLTKIYGDSNPTLTASYSGFVNGDTSASLTTAPTIFTTADATSPTGTYPITASGAVSANYTFTYVDGTLTVTPAILTITADNQTKIYGEANPTLTASYAGFVNGDTAASLATPPTIFTTADATSIVGTYPITASGAASANYTFTYVDGTLSVTPAILTITADNKTKVYGDANPTLTASYAGFVNGDTSASLTTPPNLSTTADATSVVGNYPITVNGAASSNYTITYVNGTLSVTASTLLTIIADNQTKIYGDANPVLTVTYSGFVNGDNETSLTTLPTITTIADQSSPVGTYPITASGATSPNYTIIYVDGTLTITPALLTISADNQTKIYGDANPTLTASYAGFVNGDTSASLTTAPTISTTADATSPTGTYPITASGATSANYTFTYVDGTLTVTPAVLTITANNQTKIYGDANPTLTASYSGFVNGDTSASLTTLPTISTTADATSPTGTYPIAASGAASANYTFTYVDGTLTVTPAILTITADNQTKIYGDANPTLTASYAGFVNGDTSASLTTAPTISTTADATSPTGSYPITASGGASANYTFTYVDGTLTVTPAVLTITADNQTKIYGDANPTLTASYSGFVNGDTAASLTTAPTITTTADATSVVGTYPIMASGAGSANYTFTYVDGTLTVTPAILTITADNQTKIYGDVNPTLTASYAGFVNGDTSASLTTPPTISTTADATSVVGTYPITASGAASSNYTFAYVDGTLAVTPAILTITADNQSKTYGSANPTLTASYSGFVNGDTAASLTTLPTITTTADATSPTGTYPITASGAASSNYTFTYVDGTLTITPAILTITADNQTKIYGDVNPILTTSYTGFVNGDTAASLATAPTITTTADATSVVGTYPITASAAASANYTFTYVDGTLTVTPAVVTITADNQTKIYGDVNPTLTASYAGFVNGDTAASLTTPPTITTTADVTSPTGTYPITASGAASSNYTFTYIDGTLTVTPAVLTITADNQTKIYGDVNPTLTATYSGFVNGDTSASLTTPPTISTTADATSPTGTYPITASGAVSANYSFTYVDGILSVTPAILTITADNQTKIYGDTNPTLTASYTGFVNGDTSASLTTAPTITTTANAASAVGTYPITASGAASANYTFTYIDGTLTVTPAVLTITADNQTKIYGDVNPTLTASYSGFVNGDTSASLTTPPIISTTANTASAVGNYPITASGAVSANYTFTYVDGTLTVTPAVLTVTAYNQTKIYGDANPTLTASYAGFVNGDTSASLTTPPTITTTADATSPTGTYPITASGAASSNYTFTYVDGTLTITPAVLTITADNQTKIYGDANPTLTASYSGFVNGDTSASLTTAPTITTTADATSAVGNYPITASGAASANYTFTYIDGTLTVTPAIVTITADNQTKVYGDTNPTLTASYAGFVNGDTSASLTTPPTISTTADATSPTGTYPIVASGAISSNYTFTYVDGTLTVIPAVLSIKADNQTKVYGDANPILTASYTGFVNGDTSASLTTAPTITTTADATSVVGTYPITASGAASSNYTFTYVDGTLTVTPAVVTITADNKTKMYGDANPTLTASYAGFLNGDTSASLTTPPIISTTANTASAVGNYPITASGAASANYTFVYFDGILTVTRAGLTITADNKTKTFGEANPPLTASYSGFVNGDSVMSLTTPAVISTTATAASPVGLYPISVSGAAASNYNISYVAGVLTVTSPNDVNLTSLTISSGTLSPAFSPNVLLYTTTVANNITSETIIAIANDPLASITINGTAVASGAPATISLVPGLNTVLIKVVGGDGITTKNYTINITKEESNNAALFDLSISQGTLNPGFESNINNYNAVVKYDVASITVTPTAEDAESQITVNGLAVASGSASAPIILHSGDNIIQTIVTAGDGITKETYTIVIYKGVSPDLVFANNILSPDGDGKNDFWEIKDILLYPNNTVTVYDRAGRIVYSKKSYSNEWDGSYSGSPLNNDTYYYLIDLGDSLPKIKGFITMIRN